jgi:hypothetical protein
MITRYTQYKNERAAKAYDIGCMCEQAVNTGDSTHPKAAQKLYLLSLHNHLAFLKVINEKTMIPLINPTPGLLIHDDDVPTRASQRLNRNRTWRPILLSNEY